jgi:hypothetical protein
MPLVAPVITATLPSSRPMPYPPLIVGTNIPAPSLQRKRAVPPGPSVAGRTAAPAHGEIPHFRQALPYFGFADHMK